MGQVAQLVGREPAPRGAVEGDAGPAPSDVAPVQDQPFLPKPHEPTAFYNPFTDPMAGRSRPAAELKPKLASRRLANGGRIALVASTTGTGSSQPDAGKAAEPAPAPASVEPAPTRSGGGSGGGGSGGGGSEPPGPEPKPENERTFGRDDIVGAAAALTGLLLLSLVAFPRSGEDGGPDPLVSPMSEPGPAPAPAPDPFGDGPVDLRPDSPLPESPPAVAPAEAPPAEPVCEPDRQVHALFCTDQHELALPARDALDAAINDWRLCIRNEPLVVTGYADTRGPSEYNIDLAARRANAIATILRSEGMSVAEAVGFGEFPDVGDNMNCAFQRRVDIGLRATAPITPSSECHPPVAMRDLVCP